MTPPPVYPRSWYPRAAILLLGLAAYAPALSTGFLYDDHILIESNPEIRSWSLSNVKHDFSTGIFNDSENGIGFYRPLQTLSTRIEYSLWKLNPLPYHLTNLLLHLGNALLLYELILMLGFEALTATLASCLFVTHPIIVEPLLMVSGRGEMLGFFFMLGCLLLILRQTLPCVLLGLASYLLALFSKESAIITPALLASVFYYKNEKLKRYGILIPMVAITAIYLGLRKYVLGTMGPALGTMHPVLFFIIAFPQALISYGTSAPSRPSSS